MTPNRGWRVLIAGLLLGCPAARDSAPASTPYLDAAVRAARWLQAVSSDGKGGVVPDRLQGDAPSATLGSGAAGRAVFFAELYSATGDSSFQVSALAAAQSALEAVTPALQDYGLYHGLSGIAVALAETSAIAGDAALRAEAVRLFHRIADAAQPRGERPGWGDSYDVLTGRAGIGLSLLYAFAELDDSTFLAAAVVAGDDLLAVAESLPAGGTRWVRGAGAPLDLPNFSHGTAGVGYFMARLGAVSGVSRFRDAARGAVAYLDRIADRRDGLFLVPYGVPNEGYETPHDIGWAHGPAGTARLHYELWSQTGDPEMKSRVDASARTILASGVPGPSADPTRWSGPFHIDHRFGTSGAATFLLDWGMATEDRTYLERATRIADDILWRATESEAGIFWRVPLYGFQGPGETGVFTGYFYGAAGLGLTLLQQHDARIGRRPSIRLPDDPFPRRERG